MIKEIWPFGLSIILNVSCFSYFYFFSVFLLLSPSQLQSPSSTCQDATGRRNAGKGGGIYHPTLTVFESIFHENGFAAVINVDD